MLLVPKPRDYLSFSLTPLNALADDRAALDVPSYGVETKVIGVPVLISTSFDNHVATPPELNPLQ